MQAFLQVSERNIYYIHTLLSVSFAVSYICYLKTKDFLGLHKLIQIELVMDSSLIDISPCFFCAGPLLVP